MDKFEVDSVKKNNLYESIADTIEAMILDDTLKVGERLPSEAAMAESFGVSRNIIREAMKILKERHLVELRNGDGARVVKPDSSSPKDVVNRMVIMGSLSLSEIYELREALEVSAAGLAAGRRTEEQVKGLYEIVDEMWERREDKDEWIRLDLLFHENISKASNNPLFYEFIKPMTGALEIIFDKGRNTPGALEKSVLMHRRVIQAIEAGDADAARERMREHLHQSSFDTASAQIQPSN